MKPTSTSLLTLLALAVLLFIPLSLPGGERGLDGLSRLDTQTLMQEGNEAYSAGDYIRALEAYSLLPARYDEDADVEMQQMFADCFNRQGSILYRQGGYSAAMDAYMRGRRIAETNKLDSTLSNILGNIGNIYASNYDNESATRFYNRALELIQPLPPDRVRSLRAMLFNNLTGAYYLRGMIDSARIYSRRFEQLGSMPGDSRYRYDVLLNKGMVEDGSGNLQGALHLYRSAAGYAERNNMDPIYRGAVYSQISSAFERAAMLDSALHYALLTRDIAASGDYANEQVEALRMLSEIYEKMGKTDLSVKYKARHLALADSVRLSEERYKLKRSEMLYELDRNASTIRGLNAIRTTQWHWLLGLGVVLGVVTVFVVILYRQKRSLKQAWESLYERNTRLLRQEHDSRRTIQRLEERVARAEGELAAKCAESQADTLCSEASQESAECGEVADTPADGYSRSLSLNDETQQLLARRITQVMEETELFCQPDFSIDALAKAVDSNPRYVSEVLNNVLGRNFRALLNEYRVKLAMMKLSDPANYGHLTIKAIGESVGYRSQSTFISVFTRLTGLKPSLYHRLALEKDDV